MIDSTFIRALHDAQQLNVLCQIVLAAGICIALVVAAQIVAGYSQRDNTDGEKIN